MFLVESNQWLVSAAPFKSCISCSDVKDDVGIMSGPSDKGGSQAPNSAEKSLVQIGHYVLGETLGVGTFGKVKGIF